MEGGRGSGQEGKEEKVKGVRRREREEGRQVEVE